VHPPPLLRWLLAALLTFAAVGCLTASQKPLEEGASGQIAAAPAPQPTTLTPNAADVASAQPNPAVTASGAASRRRIAGVPPLRDYVLRLPPNALERQPLTVLVALHGMGGSSSDLSRRLVEDADRHGWVLFVPNLKYRDWRDAEQVRSDGAEILPALKAALDELPGSTGLRLRERVLLLGFSRGGQSAHRFAFFYPDSTRGVAVLSAGTYTLPKVVIQRGSVETSLKFPYGVGDLEQYVGQGFNAASVRQIDFWIGVGGRDNVAGDVARNWDPYIGNSRVERARTFADALKELDVHAELALFPQAGHEFTDEMRSQAVGSLSQLSP
jgi:pimeloyl-ACP methyl ester carboxylesterase